ncbi:MAG: NADPH-dependent FMN reductase [Candidatus Contendobacter sp.]
MFVLAIAGSPREDSRSRRLLDFAARELDVRGIAVRLISVRDLPAADLLHARFDSPALREAAALVERAAGVLVATPVYQAAYSGILKAFLDLLPQRALSGKVVLPIVTGGSAAHMLALDYSLKPVLAALGAHPVLAGLYALDSQIAWSPEQGLWLAPEIVDRLQDGLKHLRHSLGWLAPASTSIHSPAEIECLVAG